MPCENFLTLRGPASPSPTSSRSSATWSLGWMTPKASAFIIRFSAAEKFMSTPGSSMSAPRREGASEKLPALSAASTAPRPAASAYGPAPNSVRVPALGVARPAIIFMVVDLPAPFLPTNP